MFRKVYIINYSVYGGVCVCVFTLWKKTQETDNNACHYWEKGVNRKLCGKVICFTTYPLTLLELCTVCMYYLFKSINKYN